MGARARGVSFSTRLVRVDRVGTHFGKDRKDPCQPGRVAGVPASLDSCLVYLRLQWALEEGPWTGGGRVADGRTCVSKGIEMRL